MHGVGSGFGDDVDYATRAAAELRVGAARRDLELLYGFQRDVDRRALAAHLLAKEPVVIVTAVEADVVEDAALPVDVDLVAVRALGDADARSQSEEVFKLASKNGGSSHSQFIKGGRGFRFCDFHNRHVGDYDLLRDRRNLHGHRQRDGLPDGEIHIFLNDRSEPGFADGEGVAARGKTQEGEMTVRVGGIRLYEIGR